LNSSNQLQYFLLFQKMTQNNLKSQTIRTKIKDDYLTCSICFNEFTTPKALPCLHTFCLDCVRDYVATRNFEAVGKFPCPMCNNEVTIPPKGVNGNLFLLLFLNPHSLLISVCSQITIVSFVSVPSQEIVIF